MGPSNATPEEGFEVLFDPEAGAVSVRAWGFWSPELASKFAHTVIDACRANRELTSLRIDARGLRPQREAGEHALGVMMAALPGLGIARATVTTDSPLTRLQLLRIAKEREVKNLFEFKNVTA